MSIFSSYVYILFFVDASSIDFAKPRVDKGAGESLTLDIELSAGSEIFNLN